jgi:hypothetical protein
MPNDDTELPNLEGLGGPNPNDHQAPGREEDPTIQEIQDEAQGILWAAGEMPPDRDVAYSLHQLDAAAGELCDHLDNIGRATSRIADVLERAMSRIDREFPADSRPGKS